MSDESDSPSATMPLCTCVCVCLCACVDPAQALTHFILLCCGQTLIPPSHYVDFRVVQLLPSSALKKTNFLNSIDLLVEQHEQAAFFLKTLFSSIEFV